MPLVAFHTYKKPTFEVIRAQFLIVDASGIMSLHGFLGRERESALELLNPNFYISK